MHLHELESAKGSRKRKRIIGRGPGSGRGKTSGRGHKGQNARAGRGILNSLEGGQVPLIRRLPKVGFNSPKKRNTQIINLDDLARLKETTINADSLKANGLIRSIFRPVKILGDGEIKRAVEVHAEFCSKTAREKIEKAGGKVHIVGKKSD